MISEILVSGKCQRREADLLDELEDLEKRIYLGKAENLWKSDLNGSIRRYNRYWRFLRMLKRDLALMILQKMVASAFYNFTGTAGEC